MQPTVRTHTTTSKRSSAQTAGGGPSPNVQTSAQSEQTAEALGSEMVEGSTVLATKENAACFVQSIAMIMEPGTGMPCQHNRQQQHAIYSRAQRRELLRDKLIIASPIKVTLAKVLSAVTKNIRAQTFASSSMA